MTDQLSLETLTGKQVLAIPMEPNDAGADTIKGYLIELLATVWRETEGFSGKRPFGNSSWPWEVFNAIAAACDMEMDQWDDYDISDDERDAMDALVAAAIQALAVEGES